MDDRHEPVTRLGPDSGGRAPGESNVRVYHWEWGPDGARRPGMPWIGIFLLVFGGLLTLVGAVNVAGASLGGYVLPLLLVALGVLLIMRGSGNRFGGTGRRPG